jgi:hypothetical protein
MLKVDHHPSATPKKEFFVILSLRRNLRQAKVGKVWDLKKKNITS